MYTKFSVLMSVYFKENPNYLKLSLDSIINNTITPNEIILVKDGKLTKELDEVIGKYKKKYPNILKTLDYENNRGLGKALHDGILECSNEIIFRMDTDDICKKDRFEKQLMIFNNMNVDVVGTNILEFDNDMKIAQSERRVPKTNQEIYERIKKQNPINHMTVGYKKSKVIESGNYLDMPYFEDYYLWARMIKNNCKFYNIQENLVDVRGGVEMIKRRGGMKYIKPIINFEKQLKHIGIINGIQYIKNTFERVIVSILPNKLRHFLYLKKLRNVKGATI